MALDHSKLVSRLSADQLRLVARRLKSQTAAGDGDRLVPMPRDASGLPLSFTQERLWFLDQLQPGLIGYNVAVEVRFRGSLNAGVLRRSLTRIVARHEALRTTFRVREGSPEQTFAEASPVQVPVVDLSGLPSRSREEVGRELAAREARAPFDLATGPLLRAKLLRHGEGEHRLLLVLHHIVCDGTSAGILVREFARAYGRLAVGEEPDLPDLPVQFADYAAWQRRQEKNGAWKEAFDFWQRELAALPPLALRTDRPRPAIASGNGGRRYLETGAEHAEAVFRLAQEAQATPFMVLVSVFSVLLARLGGGDDFGIATPVAGRPRPEIQGVIGFFADTLVLRTAPRTNPTFRELLRQVGESVIAAFANQDLPFARLVQKLAPDRILGATPLAQAMFSLEERPPLPSLGGVELSLEEIENRTSKFDLLLALRFASDGRPALGGYLEYSTDLFEPAWAARCARQLARLLGAVGADPSVPVFDLPLFGATERHQLLVEWNDTESAGLAETIPGLLAAQCARSPGATAVVDGSDRLTYRELHSRARGLAGELRRRGVGTEVRVGVCLERSADLVVALLGVLLAGGAYVPLDPAYPQERIDMILADSSAALVVTRRGLVDRVSAAGLPALRLEEMGPEAGGEPLPLETGAGVGGALPGSLAYLIYTSGSTGRPKGVGIEHRHAAGFLTWARRTFSDEELAGVLAATSVCFDLSVFEIFAPLAWGGSVILAGSVLDLRNLPAAGEVTLVNSVPSAVTELVRSGLPPAVRTVNLAGEALPRILVDQLFALPSVERVLNLYGPSEDTTYSTLGTMARDDARPPSIGRPVAETRAYLLDSGLGLVPIGVPGELALASRSLARGYLGRPDLTAERFGPDPFSPLPGGRMYRTGDLCSLRPDGELEFIGRGDQQVKVRGFRIELGEIEAALRDSPGVDEAVAAVYTTPLGDRRLAAYYTARSEGDTTEDHLADLRSRLPAYMVPAALLRLPALPRTPNGKIDRRALPSPDWSSAAASTAAPRTALEQLLAGFWCEILGVERVGRGDRFFDLGGHSLLATQLVARVRAALGVELPVRAVFEAPDLAALALRVEEAMALAGGDAAPAVALPPLVRQEGSGPGGEPPLSYSQQRLWLVEQIDPGGFLYNVPYALQAVGRLRVPVLAAALQEIVRRHAALRTTFAEAGGAPVQRVAPPTGLQLPVVDLGRLSDPRAAAESLATAEARTPFDLERGPLFRFRLLRLGAEEHLLLLTFHHIVADGWSLGVLFAELAALYEAFALGRPSPLRELAVQYTDFALWQRSWLTGAVIERQLAFWRSALAGAPDLDLPRDLTSGSPPGAPSGALTASLPQGRDGAARPQARALEATPFLLHFAAFAALLSRVSGSLDVCVAIPVAGRRAVETEGMIGFFVNTLVLRVDLSGGPSFAAIVGRVRRAFLEADAHQDLPFDRLVEELRPGRSGARPPLARALFNYQRLPATTDSWPDLRFEGREVETGASKFDISLSLVDSPEALTARLGFAADLFRPPGAARFLLHYEILLGSALGRPEQPLHDLPLLSPAERSQLLVEWNEAGAEPEPAPTVPILFAAHAARAPGAPALVFGDRRLSYGELRDRANRLARYLLRHGAGVERPVALLLERSELTVVAILAAFQAGSPYVPLDPSLPSERLRTVLEDSGARLLVSTSALASRLSSADSSVGSEPRLDRVLLDVEAEWIEGESAEAPGVPLRSENLAYVIFTSGSTGRPKGVAVEHRQLAAYVRGVVARLALAECASFGLASTFAADLGHTSLFPALATGGCLHVLSQDEVADADAFAEAVERYRLDVLKIVPSHLSALLTGANPEKALPRRRLILGGEASSWDEVERIRSLAPGCAIFNHYGPTESTVGAAAFAVPSDERRRDSARVPLGRPLPGARLYVVDPGLHPSPIGVPGELWIGGSSVARGYVGRPDLTAEGFAPDAWSGIPGARAYRTGDRVRRLPGGDLEFLGRFDEQVKIRGYRVEPLEVAALLEAQPEVRQAVVLTSEDGAGGTALVAYLVAAAALDLESLRRRLEEHLPGYMIPAAFVELSALPLTPNGKVDRAALPRPEPATPVEKQAAPRTETEALLSGLMSEILGREEVGIHVDFFAAGGHSLAATRLMARARRAFGVELPVRALFEAPTVAGLAARIDSRRRSGVEARPPLVRRQDDGDAALSFSQERFWFLDQLEPGNPTYSLPYFARVRGPLAAPVLSAVLEELARRHEGLRVRFPSVEGRPLQRFSAEPDLPLPLVDLSGLPSEAREREHWILLEAEARRPWNLAEGPLVRARLFRLEAEEHAFALSLHHIVSDAWSRGILARETAALYAAAASGEGSPLAAPELRYRDYSRWQRDWLNGETLQTETAWWRDRLGGLPPLQLPQDRPRPRERSGRGGAVRVPLSPTFGGRVEAAARPLDATPYMLLLAVFAAQLHRYGAGDPEGQGEGVAIASPVANRSRSEVEGVVGCFVNTLVLPVRPGAVRTFEGLVAQVRETALGAYDHQDLPFEKVVEAVAGERDLHRPPLASVALVHQGEPIARLDFGGLRWEPVDLHTGTAKFDLTLAFADVEGELRATLEFDRDLFDEATAGRLAGHFARLASAALESPAALLPELPLLSAAERAEIALWNESLRSVPVDLRLHQLVAAQAARTPDREALVSGERRLTYRELDLLACRLARELRRLGIGPEKRVGVLLRRGPELVVGLLGILKAGGAYVPLDPSYPAERLAWMAEDAALSALLHDADGEGSARSGSAGSWAVPRLSLPLQSTAGLADEADGETADDRTAPENLAYLIYTSGSTGRPKAVAIEHRSVAALIYWAREVFSDEELSGVLAATSISFDLSVFELFVPLAWGGKVVLADDILALPGLPAASEVRLVNTVPSAMAELVRLGALPSGVRTINLAGEALPRALADRLFATKPAPRLLNLFGPSEDTTYSTWSEVATDDLRPPAIGRPLAATRAWVLDASLGLLPTGVAGELYLGGEGLARGYLGRPALTAERFVPDPFAAFAGSRLYRTGDLCRLRPDGELEYLGRLDQQVKVRGFRIEPGETENAIIALPGVREAVVLAREEEGGTRALVAWVALEGGGRSAGEPLAPRLRRLLAERLPAHMIPSTFVEIAALPRTLNGKVDRRALPAPAAGAEEGAETPRTPIEECVAAAWAEILGGAEPGNRESFFEAGGHSLLATRLVARLRSALGVDLPLKAVFERPTVAGLALEIERLRREESGVSIPPLTRSLEPGSRLAPLSFGQERLWFLDQLAPGDPSYNVTQAIALEGPLDRAALEASLVEVLRRHEPLRGRVVVEATGPMAERSPGLRFTLPRVDLSALPDRAGEREAGRLARQEALRPFDLARAPLLRAVLVDRREGDALLLFGFHHIAGDGWSLGVLVRELGELYAAVLRGEASPLSELPLGYGDYAAWQRSWLRGEVVDREIAATRARLGDVPAVLELPADRPRGRSARPRGALLPWTLSAPLAAGLARAGRREGATLFMALLAGFHALLHRYTGETRLAVGVPVAGRNQVETEGMVGLFVNSLVLCGDLSGAPTFGELLRRARADALDAWTHQDLPFERLVQALQPDRNLGSTPLFQVLFALQNAPLPALDLPGLAVHPVEVEKGGAKFELSLILAERQGEVAGWIEYDSNLFDGARMERLAGHLLALYAGAAEASALPVGELPLLAAEERSQILREWSGALSQASGADRCLQERFEEQALRTPRAVALVSGRRRLTYADLDGQANRLASWLRRHGVGPERRVAVLLERSPEMVVALFAILKAGGAYVPLDPAYPRERLAIMAEDAGFAAIVTQERLAGLLPAPLTPLPLVRVDADRAELEREPDGHLGLRARPENLAYVIFTSGSTGRPKGVGLEHRSASAFVHWARSVFSPEDLDGVLASTSISFDLSVFEIFVPLSWGGKVVLAANALELATLPAAGEVRLVNTVPSAVAELVAMEALPPAVRVVNLAGEALLRPLVERIGAAGVEKVFNLYGPSEDTTYSTFALIPFAEPRTPSIGRPLPGTRAYLLDSGFGPVPAGVPGELYLGGAGLARGYLARPDLTAARFVPDPFAARAGERLYRTGDLCVFGAGGEIEFLGRTDHQTKIRGFRVEPGEVEAALLAEGRVHEAVVVVGEHHAGGKELVAYFAPRAGAEGEPGSEVSAEELRVFLALRLPAYMIPAAFVCLTRLPRTPNGKVDRRALPALERGLDDLADSIPATPTEEVLARLWSELLGAPIVGSGANFFDLGGHSLLAARLVHRLGDVFGVAVPLQEVFEHPALRQLAGRIDALRFQGVAAPVALRRVRPQEDSAPLSYAQERLWFLDRFEQGRASLNIPVTLELRGPLDGRALARSLTEVARRHEVLRSTFRSEEGRGRQRTVPASPVPLPRIDLGALPPSAADCEAARLADEDAIRPFDLELGPPFRVRLVAMEKGTHRLQLSLHHIVADGWSIGILVREMSVLYRAYSSGAEGQLPALALQYGDFAAWQRSEEAEGLHRRQLGYWRDRLAGAPPSLELPTDRPRPSVQSFRGGRRSLALERDLADRLAAVARRRSATPFMALLAAWTVLLSRASGQTDLVVGTPFAGRNGADLERLIGLFLNSLTLRSDLSGSPGFDELIDRVRDSALGAYAHQDVPFERVLAELKPERDLSRTPLFQVLFNMLSFESAEVRLPGLEVRTLETPELPAKFDLTVYLAERPSGILLTLVYNADLFDGARVEEMLRQYRLLLAAAAADPALPVDRISLITPEAAPLLPDPRAALDATWRGSVHRIFARWAADSPQRLAVADPQGTVTYGELERRSDEVARSLLAGGLRLGEPVAVYAHRSAPIVWAVLGILKAGGAFVILDPAYPARRLVELIELAQPRAWIAIEAAGALPPEVEEHVARLPWRCRLRLGFETHPAGEEGEVLLPVVPIEVGPDDLAYIAFTSGSTGTPKGVLGRHGPLSHFLPWQQRRFGFSPSDRFSMLSGIAHDPLHRDIFTPLQIGAAIVIPDPSEIVALGRLADWLRREEVTVVHLTPAMGQVIAQARPGTVLPDLRYAFLVGDVLSRRDAERLQLLAPGLTCVNYFGSTETQRAVGYYVIPPFAGEGGGREAAKEILPLGQGIEGVQLLVLRRDGELAGVGEVGEICIRSPHLARGYLDDPEKTAEKFVSNPFTAAASDRLYRTGDLGRYLADGNVAFLGRADQQVKIRGYRIELGEIQGVLGRHPLVREAVVVPWQDDGGEKRLAAYLVGEAGGAPPAGEIRRFLQERLPEYMVPAAFLFLERLPLTANGKLDRSALPEPQSARRGERELVPPRSRTEAVIAEVWREVLNLESVGVFDNFFDLGGHSLLLLQAQAELERRLSLSIAVVDLFRYPTIDALAKSLAREPAATDEVLLERRERAERKLKAIEARRRAAGRKQ